MTNERWTVRGVRSRAIEAIRSLSQETGQSAGQLVSAAILDWVGCDEEEPREAKGHNDDLVAALAVLHRQIGETSALVHRLMGPRAKSGA